MRHYSCRERIKRPWRSTGNRLNLSEHSMRYRRKNLLNILCNNDTASRSARVASETCLVSACDVQESRMRSLIESERASLEERLRHLADAERAIEETDVRADLDAYIQQQPKRKIGVVPTVWARMTMEVLLLLKQYYIEQSCGRQHGNGFCA